MEVLVKNLSSFEQFLLFVLGIGILVSPLYIASYLGHIASDMKRIAEALEKVAEKK